MRGRRRTALATHASPCGRRRERGFAPRRRGFALGEQSRASGPSASSERGRGAERSGEPSRSVLREGSGKGRRESSDPEEREAEGSTCPAGPSQLGHIHSAAGAGGCRTRRQQKEDEGRGAPSSTPGVEPGRTAAPHLVHSGPAGGLVEPVELLFNLHGGGAAPSLAPQRRSRLPLRQLRRQLLPRPRLPALHVTPPFSLPELRSPPRRRHVRGGPQPRALRAAGRGVRRC